MQIIGGKWRVNARLVKTFRCEVLASVGRMQSAVLAVSRVQPFHGETGRTRSFTIELRGARAKEADCIRPTSWFAPLTRLRAASVGRNSAAHSATTRSRCAPTFFFTVDLVDRRSNSTRNPIAAIVRHVGSMPDLGYRRNALRFSALRALTPNYISGGMRRIGLGYSRIPCSMQCGSLGYYLDIANSC
jgi:hypothetical protein